MPRVILTLGAGAQTADVRASALSQPFVMDAVEAAQANGVIVSVDDLTSERRDQLANLPGVTGVHDDLQGIPLVADEQEVEDFLDRVRGLRGEENAPPVFQTEPTRPNEPRPDGGAVVLPVPQEESGPAPEQTGPLSNVDDSISWTGAQALHEQGILGESVISVVVDTGACRAAVHQDRQLDGADLAEDSDAWTLLTDHGGMSLGIMAGDDSTPGVNVGYLPESEVFPIKTTLAASELMQAQDIIVELAEDTEKTVVVNNCLTADAMVSTTKGPKPIVDVEVGDRVYAANLDVRGQRVCEVTETFESGKKEVYDLQTRTRSVTASDNHPFLVADQEQERLVWKQLEDIDEGDLIAIRRSTTAGAGKPHQFAAADGGQLALDDGKYVRLAGKTSSKGCTIPRQTTEEFCRVLGALYGDGSVTYSTSNKNRVLFTANLDKYPEMERYVEEFERVFGVEWIVRGEQGAATTFAVNNKPLADFLHRIGIRVGKERTLPGWLYTLPEDQKIAFLRGYLDADGHVDKRGHIHVRTTHGEMARELWELFVSAGIKVTRVKTQVQDIDVGPSGNSYPDHEVFHFTASSPEDNRRIGSALPEYRRRLSQEREKPMVYDYVDYWTPAVDGFVFDRVVSIESKGVEPTYDIEVSGAHNFVANGILAHNSWGFPECEGICSHPVTTAIASAADHPNVIQVFAAGNEASGITGCGQECDGSTPGISGPNSLSNVITVAATGRNGQPAAIQDYSSRGSSGEVACGQRKPDVAAPIFGETPFGCGQRDMGNGGGTSAACPQVAGAVGLLADARASISTASARAGLQAASNDVDPPDFDGCTGSGNIRVDRALDETPDPGEVDTPSKARLGVGAASAVVSAALLGAAWRQRHT